MKIFTVYPRIRFNEAPYVLFGGPPYSCQTDELTSPFHWSLPCLHHSWGLLISHIHVIFCRLAISKAVMKRNSASVSLESSSVLWLGWAWRLCALFNIWASAPALLSFILPHETGGSALNPSCPARDPHVVFNMPISPWELWGWSFSQLLAGLLTSTRWIIETCYGCHGLPVFFLL